LGNKYGIEFKSPGLKVTKEYEVSKKIHSILNVNDVLISPDLVSSWISTMHWHPKTLIYRNMIT
jgi:hypothetical protein